LKAVILAAGEGSRMRPLTYSRPKVMVPIANKPIIEYLLLAARDAGVSEFIFVVGYRDEQVRDYFGDGERWGVKIEYCNQKRQMGTADALRMVEGLVGDSFLMMNGDIILHTKDIKKVIARGGNVLGAIEVKDPVGLGVVEVSRGKVTRIHEKTEKPPSRLANAGLYLFIPAVFEAIAATPKSPRGEYEITTSLQIMINKGAKVSCQELSYWLPLNYPWDLLMANETLMAGLKERIEGELEENVVVRGVVAIGEGTVVKSGTYIVGPVVIGANCNIGPNCYIRPSTSIGDGCHIGNAVEIKNSIIMKNTAMPHHNYIGDSVIGEGCNFGAGTKIANLRLDEASVSVGSINTSRRKLGAIIGDEVKTGINASINVGTMIGDNTHIGPGVVVSGVIAPNSRLL
jgi:bifunctional UDP-N-acetylglucosamine pyrophosphorylase/glucosamine-1-phosphate N-acetyltransferase